MHAPTDASSTSPGDPPGARYGSPSGEPPAAPPIDVFAKVHGHEREQVLRAAREADVLPYFHVLSSPAMPVVEMEGAQRIMLGSNNYLGLTGDERVMQGAEDALHRYGTGLTGSRFLNGTIPLHLELEREIAEWMNAEDALVFTTGHQANLSVLGTILGPTDTVIVDAGDHASILDGCLLSRAKLRPFRHNRLDKLEKMLQRAQGDGGGVLVVVDGVFSMEGDIAPLPDICDLCERYGARLMVDEAHGAGVLGLRGAGAAELLGVEERVDLRMGTFSKSLASCGGFVAGPADVIEYLRIYSRAFLFTASAVPAALGAALGALRVMRSADGPPLLARVLDNAWRLRDGLAELGFAVVSPQPLPTGVSAAAAGGRSPIAGVRSDAAGAPAIVTPIVPVLVGDDWKAALLWRALYDAGVFVNTALHPAVPPGGALLRTSVMATHDEPTIDRALAVFARVKREFEAEHGPLPGPRA
ncbi:MAG TPA: aminotransferase class I/II-fold pyridoxal phosphate-dependent enzyme [Solirubrobacteraceae bacterium]|jgi:8-amino-7-oxononanoate synthase|nr:aminotransferase class I/II-fold pyridoxal phosphate-dependent enzyme [Solirubrobacteraceae bacterium]